MRLLHTADWHLGKRLDRFSRLQEQGEVLQEICDIAEREKVDAVIIAGDLFDSFNPPTEAVELFYKTLKRLAADGQRAVIAIAGNHDSPDRIEAPDPLARECGIILVGYPNSRVVPFALESGLAVTRSDEGFLELQLPENQTPLRLLLTPYASENRLKTCLGFEDTETEMRQLLQQRWQALAERYCDSQGINILVAHLFMIRAGETPPEEPEDEKPILHIGGAQAIYSEHVPPQIQYAALGHLHGMRVVSDSPCPLLYSSSPLAYSMSEANQEKYLILLEAEAGQKPVHYREIPLKSGRKLIRRSFSSVARAVSWLKAHPDTLVELTMVTETFLTAEERKALTAAHEGIVTIIPAVKNVPGPEDNRHPPINLSQSMEKLFIEYFQYKHQQKPNDELLALFREILSTECE